MRNLHTALKTSVIQDVAESGFNFKHVRLQNGKDDFVNTLHVRPNSYTSSGLQSTDLLSLAGFNRSQCDFFQSECFVREIAEDFDLSGFANSTVTAFKNLQQAASHLENCGLRFPQPEGFGFFFGKPAQNHYENRSYIRGDGHTAATINRMKESEDEYFQFVFSWIEASGKKGWTTHYRAKHMPLSSEFVSALDFLGGFSTFAECPEFDFEMCWWRFSEYEDTGDVWNRKTEYVHRCFDAHANNFSLGLKSLLTAHAELERYGVPLLTPEKGILRSKVQNNSPTPRIKKVEFNRQSTADLDKFDVAISFAGTERDHARQLAEILRDAGYVVFYDDFYPEQLWGKDLVAFFDRVYRKASKYCVMLISAEYAERIWTTHERRSAQARALTEKGKEYILPIRFDDTDLDGLPPTIGYIPYGQFSIEQISELLIKKLKAA